MINERFIKSGKAALWDTFAGLVPVMVTAIRGRGGRPSSDNLVDFTVTKDHGPYKKGETRRDEWSIHVVPRAALIKTQFSTRIGFYIVEADAGPA